MKTILVIDDDPNVHLMLAPRIEAKGYVLLNANDGSEGYEVAKEKQPDIILLDMIMPVGGLEVLDMLKETVETNEIPVVMLTANDQREDIFRAFKLGARDYVVKPFNYDVLFEKIKNILEEKK